MMREEGLRRMSRPHARVQSPQVQRRPWLEVVVGTVSFLLLIAIAVSRFPRDTYDTRHVTAKGDLFETRIAVKGTSNSMFGGKIPYQIQARVRYDYQGQSQERWMTASELSSRESLQARLADLPKTCEVYWVPKHPHNPKCRFVVPSQ